MGKLTRLLEANRGSAATEMAMVTPLLIAILFGSFEVGNYFLDQHAVAKAVRDGARYASRMTLDPDYACPAQVFDDASYQTTIENVTKTGSVDGTGTGRFPAAFWADACPGSPAFQVTVRCVPQGDYQGIYTGLAGDIPVVKVTAAVSYPSVLGTIGINTSGLCLRAESEAAVAGL